MIAAAVIGNLLEVFDFIAYGTFAVMIGHAPSSRRTTRS